MDEEGRCVPCDSIFENCIDCTVDRCTECDCELGYVLNDDQLCQVKGIPYCVFQRDGECIECQNGAVLKEGICIKCDFPCQECDPEDRSKCTLCFEDFVLTAEEQCKLETLGVQVSCLEGEFVSLDTIECTKVEEGHRLTGPTSTVPCEKNCLECNSTDCLRCDTKWYPFEPQGEEC